MKSLNNVGAGEGAYNVSCFPKVKTEIPAEVVSCDVALALIGFSRANYACRAQHFGAAGTSNDEKERISRPKLNA
jgi:hypothetical protein